MTPAIHMHGGVGVSVVDSFMTDTLVPAGAVTPGGARRVVVIDRDPIEIHDRRPWSINYGARTSFESDGSIRIEGANHPALRMEQIRAVARAEGVRIVRAGLHHIRVQLGETTDEHETYQPRHAKPQEQP